MSLATAPKHISETPTRGSVVDPVDKAAKDADIERKLKFFGVIQAFRRGKFPSNHQVDAALEYVLRHSPIDESQLSSEGRRLVQDLRFIIETAKLMVREKNSDELIQKFLWDTRGLDQGKVDRGTDSSLTKEQQRLKSDAPQAAEHLRTLLNLALTNSEVRKLFSDFALIGRDLLARSAAKAADIVQPDEHAMSKVDDPAPHNQFVTAGGRTIGHEETPILEARLPGTNTTIQNDPSAPQPTVQGPHVPHGRQHLGQVMEEGRATQQHAKGRAFEEAEHAKNETQLAAQRAQAGDDATVEEKKNGFMDKVRGIRDNLTDRIPQKHRDTAEDHYHRGREFLDEYFPEERRDQFIYRGKKAIIECQKHDDWQVSMKWLLDQIKEYVKRGSDVAGKQKEGVAGLTDDAQLRRSMEEFRTILERFANGRSMNPIFDAIDALADDARRDETLRAWFRSVDKYMRRVLLEPGYVLDDDCNKDGERLRDHGRHFYDDTYREHFDNLFDSIGTWLKGMTEDPLNSRFGEDWARLTHDLLFDREGSLAFKTELWNDVRKVILPMIVDKVGYMPIPRIEYTDDSLDLVVENLTLSGRNLFPNVVMLEAHNFFKFSPYSAIADRAHHRFTLTFSQMQADMRDVAFWFRKKGGIKMTDSGLADVLIGGDGLKAVVTLTSTSKDRSSVFHVTDVLVKVDQLKFSIRDSKHDLLYKTLKPLATGLVKRQIQKAVADMIRTGLEYVDGQLVGVRDRMEIAKATEGDSRTKALQELFHKSKDTAGSVKSTDSTGRHSQFKVVANKRDSLLSTEGNPAGWVNRAEEKTQTAEKGSEWRSEAFTIV